MEHKKSPSVARLGKLVADTKHKILLELLEQVEERNRELFYKIYPNGLPLDDRWGWACCQLENTIAVLQKRKVRYHE